MQYAIGIDVGGTKILAGVVREDGTICHHRYVLTLNRKGENIVRYIEEVIRVVLKEWRGPRIKGVGVGIRGWIDPVGGIAVSVDDFELKDYPLRCVLEKRLQVPVVVENDANASIWGEYCVGAGQGLSQFSMVTVGTGIGSGIILDGKIFHGAHYHSGELGHVSIDAGGTVCSCGGRGCLEPLISGPTLIKRFGCMTFGLSDAGPERLDTPEQLVSAAVSGHLAARRVLERAGVLLAHGIANLIKLFDPECVLLGGGMGIGMAPVWLPIIREEWHHMLIPTDLGLATLGEQAGMIGAAYLILGFPEHKPIPHVL